MEISAHGHTYLLSDRQTDGSINVSQLPVAELGQIIKNIQVNPAIAIDLLEACEAAKATIGNPLNPVRMQIQAAIDMAKLGHMPKRPLPLLLEIEAVMSGAHLDSESLEQPS